MHPWVKWIQVCSNEEPFNSRKVNVYFLISINIMIIILPIRLQKAKNCTQMLLDLDVYYFPQMCQFVLVKDYNKENNAQITKCI